MKEPAVVIGTVGVDCHIIGARAIAYVLEKAGFKVVWLGVMCAHEEFINAAIETGARAILISSLVGNGLIECDGLRRKCVEAGLDRVLLYIGGRLVVASQDMPAQAQDWESTEKAYKEIGFDRAYPPETLPATVIADLRRDMELAGSQLAPEVV